MASYPNEPYYQRQAGNKRLLALLGVALILGGIGLLAYRLFLSASPQSAGTRLVLDAGPGEVLITAWDQPTIKVDWAAEDDGDFDVTTATEGDVTTVKTTVHCMTCDDLTFNIRVPRETHLEIDGTSSAIVVDSVRGDMRVKTKSGDLSLRNSGGMLDFATNSGKTTIVDGDFERVAIAGSSGDLSLSGSIGAFKIETSSGVINITNARAATLDLETSSADITYAGGLSSDGIQSISTSSGNVNLQVPANSNFTLDGATKSGTLTTDFDLSHRSQDQEKVSGTVGDGGTILKITSNSGDIMINKQ